ncbi:MAG: hypothetical protein AB7T49_10365 [Oligoflexales bacterium]
MRTSATLSHIDLSEEAYYEKIAYYLSFLPCSNRIQRNGASIIITVKDEFSAEECVSMMGSAPALFQITEVSDRELHVLVFKTTSQELVLDAIKNGLQCVTDAAATEKGFELKISEGDGTNECISLLSFYFNIVERSQDKVVLDYVTKGFTCESEDKSLTIEHRKDFGTPHYSDIFDAFSFAKATRTRPDGSKVTTLLDHCDMVFTKVPGQNDPDGSYFCKSSKGKTDLRHEFQFRPGYFGTIAIENGVKTPTTCKWDPRF